MRAPKLAALWSSVCGWTRSAAWGSSLRLQMVSNWENAVINYLRTQAYDHQWSGTPQAKLYLSGVHKWLSAIYPLPGGITFIWEGHTRVIQLTQLFDNRVVHPQLFYSNPTSQFTNSTISFNITKQSNWQQLSAIWRECFDMRCPLASESSYLGILTASFNCLQRT